MHVCIHKHPSMLSPKEFLEIRCSEIASEAILGQKQSRSSYVHGSRSIASNFCLFMYAFAKPAEFEFLREKVL